MITEFKEEGSIGIKMFISKLLCSRGWNHKLMIDRLKADDIQSQFLREDFVRNRFPLVFRKAF